MVLALLATSADAEVYQHCGVPTTGIPGPEDFDVHRSETGQVTLFVSSIDRTIPEASRRGALFSVPVTSKGLGPPRILVEKLGSCPLRPHGISLIQESDGVHRLYVINHRSKHDPEECRDYATLHTIERFALDGDRLHFEGTIDDPILTSPNDLFATSEGALYVTNETTHRNWFLKLVDWMPGPGASKVVRVSETEPGEVVARWIHYANGIARRGDRAFVSSAHDRVVHVYDVADDDTWSHRGDIEVGMLADNLLFGPGGRLYVAGHPKLSALSAHMKHRW